MRILVTGANGQLGRCISDASHRYHPLELVLTDKDTLDVTNHDDWRQYLDKNFDVIINTAGYTDVDGAEIHTKEAFSINASSTLTLSKMLRGTNTKLIHISTDYVFAGDSHKPYHENDITSPLSHYGLTKQMGERNVIGLTDGFIVRTSWLYSEYGKNFVKTMLRLGKEKDVIKVVSDQIGAPTSAHDLADVLIKMSLKLVQAKREPPNRKPRIFHYTNSGVASWYDFATSIMEIGNLGCVVHPCGTDDFLRPAKRPKFSVLDTARIQKEFDLKIPRHWREALKEVISKLGD
jgi:dTDP-4-dehydrorhamnose reductase